MILISYTFCQIQRISPHGPKVVFYVCVCYQVVAELRVYLFVCMYAKGDENTCLEILCSLSLSLYVRPFYIQYIHTLYTVL